MAYAAGWKKFEPLWDAVIRARRTALMLPVLESILSEFGRRQSGGARTRSYVRRASPWSEPALARESRVPPYGRAIVV